MMLGGLSGLYLNIFTSCRLRSCWEVVERLLGGCWEVAGRLLGDCLEVIKRLLGRLSRLFFEHLQISEGWEVIGRIFKRTLGGESGFF